MCSEFPTHPCTRGVHTCPPLCFHTSQALAAATGRTEQRIKDALREEGDLGVCMGGEGGGC